MDTAVISSIIAASSVILSALISFGVAKMTAQKEIEKLNEQQKLQDKADRKDAFSLMVKAVDYYILQVRQGTMAAEVETPSKAISRARVLFSSPIAEAIDALQASFQNDDDLDDLRRCLNKAVDEYRNHKDDSRQDRRKSKDLDHE